MKKQICSSFLMILIVGAIVMSVLNFSTKAYANDDDAIWGTTTRETGGLLDDWWHMNGRYLGHWGGSDWFCVGRESNCVIVFGI